MAFDAPFKEIFGVDGSCDMTAQVDDQLQYISTLSIHVSIFRMLSNKWFAKILPGTVSWGSAIVVVTERSHSMNKFKICSTSLNLMRCLWLLKLTIISDSQFQVVYTQWVSTDRTELLSINDTPEDFVDKLFDALQKLKKHGFVAQNQHKVPI